MHYRRRCRAVTTGISESLKVPGGIRASVPELDGGVNWPGTEVGVKIVSLNRRKIHQINVTAQLPPTMRRVASISSEVPVAAASGAAPASIPDLARCCAVRD